jgi:hypothetical protein
VNISKESDDLAMFAKDTYASNYFDYVERDSMTKCGYFSIDKKKQNDDNGKTW